MERICVYPGSFDPITVGHLDIIRRAAELFDSVVVAVLHNPGKAGCFTVEERVAMIADACREVPRVSVDAFDGLLTDYMRRTGANAVVRGLRSVTDFASEQTMAQLNAQLLPGMETVFLMTRPEHAVVSSSAVREIASFGGDISAYVPAAVLARVKAHYHQ